MTSTSLHEDGDRYIFFDNLKFLKTVLEYDLDLWYAPSAMRDSMFMVLNLSLLGYLLIRHCRFDFLNLLGKRILVFSEGKKFEKSALKFLIMLGVRYLDTQDTTDEFEVIYITKNIKESPYSEFIPFMPWFVSLESELLPIDFSSYCCCCHLGNWGGCSHSHGSSLLAFDTDGSDLCNIFLYITY